MLVALKVCEGAPDTLLQVVALTQEQHALAAHFLQLLLQPQMVLDLLLGIVVAQLLGVEQFLHVHQSLQILWYNFLTSSRKGLEVAGVTDASRRPRAIFRI